MGSDDFEACVVSCEVISDRKCNYSGKVASKVVLLACLQMPVFDLFELLEAMVIQVTSTPLDGMVGGDSMVDERDEAVGELPTATEKCLHNIFYKN